MNLYQEKLQKYRMAEEAFKEAERTFEEAKKSFEQEKEEFRKYVQDNIIFTDYKIGHIESIKTLIMNAFGSDSTEDELYYPMLNLPEGFKMESENFYCNRFSEDDFEDFIIHEYTLINEETGLKIHVSAKASMRKLSYFNEDIQLEIKSDTLVMDGIIKYIVHIDDKEFEVERNFNGNLIDSILSDRLKDKYICYGDFAKISSKQSRKRRYKGSRYIRYCRNFRLNSNSNWKENFIEYYLEKIISRYESEKIVSDIEENLKEITLDNYIRKVYYLNEENSLIVELSEENTRRDCIVYEDEQLILEIPLPIRYIKLYFAIINKPYHENLEHSIVQDDIKENDTFSIRMTNDLDMDKKMCVLDILDEFKKKG